MMDELPYYVHDYIRDNKLVIAPTLSNSHEVGFFFSNERNEYCCIYADGEEDVGGEMKRAYKVVKIPKLRLDKHDVGQVVTVEEVTLE